MGFKNILVPVDFSDCSKNALRFAIGLAKKFNAKIHLVNAVNIHHSISPILGSGMMGSIVGEYESQIKQAFEELEKEIIELKDVPHRAEQFISYLIDAINQECEKYDIDLIIMGTRETHDKIEHFLGSRTSDVIASAQIPVLVIPGGWKDHKIEKIGFAFEAQEIKNSHKLRMLNSLAVTYQANILGFTVKSESAEIGITQQNVFEEIISNFDEGVASIRTIETDTIMHGIHQFSEDHELDILALIPKPRNLVQKIFNPSFSKNLVLDSKIPILSFRE